MANYDSNYAIAQEISARIGVSPIPFDSVYSIALEIYNELGGEPTQFDSVYSILLGILPLVEGGVASKVIDDSVITTVKTWSSSKINSELSGKQNTISDLSDIRSGAALGATALQSVPSEYVTDTELSTELAGYATTSAMTSGLAAKQDTLTAGSNITISGNTISATDTTYSAGSGITISGTSVSVDSNLLSEINGKQDELVAGTNITISGTTISATYEVATTADIEALFS